MRNLPLISVLFGLLTLACGRTFAADAELEVALTHAAEAEYLEMDAMAVRFSPEAEALGERFGNALDSHGEWAMTYMREHIDERPLPYHENFGLTESEYRHWLKISEDRHFQSVAKVNISVHALGGGKFRMNGGPEVPWITGIEFDLRNRLAKVPSLADPLKLSPYTSGKLPPVGKAKGVRGKYEEGDLLTAPLNEMQGHSVTVEALVTEKGVFVLSYTDMSIKPGAVKETVDVLLVAADNTTRNGRQ